MILQKTCHDMDIMAWLVGKKCKKVHSFGSLSYFTRENAPADAPEYCIDGCPHAEECPYNAVKIYYDDKENHWFRTTCTKMAQPTDEDVEHAIRTTDYGKCVFKCPNNVVDHQVVNLEFEDGIYASFTMSSFNKGGREIRIMGTKGELRGSMDSPIITIYDFLTKETREIDLDKTALGSSITDGHGGGDRGIMEALLDVIEGRENRSACDIGESCDNHMISFAAEESRLNDTVINMEEYSARFN
jgi:predicted dehydrogenase